MPKKTTTRTRKLPGQTIINPAASRVPTTTPTPFAGEAAMQPVRPVTAPRLRQITEGPSVRIIGGRAI